MLLCGVTNARSKEPGVYLTVCAGMCVCVCGVPANAVLSQSEGRGSTRLHEDESVSWSARAKIPHTHFTSIQANGLICNRAQELLCTIML